MSSDDDATQLMAAFRKGGTIRPGANDRKSLSATPAPRRSTPRRSPARREPPKKRTSIAVENFLFESSSGEDVINAESPPKVRRLLHIRPKPIANKDEYTYYEPRDEVESIVKESTKRGNDIAYVVKLVGGGTKEINFDELLELPGGSEALNNHQKYDDASSPSADDMRLRGKSPRAKNDGFVDITTVDISSSEDEDIEDEEDELAPRRRQRRPGRPLKGAKNSGRTSRSRPYLSDPIQLTSSDEDSEDAGKKRRGRKKKVVEPTRRSTRQPVPVRAFDEDESEVDEESTSDSDNILRSDVLPGRKRKRAGLRASKPEKVPRIGARQSERSTRATNNMGETGENDIYRSDSAPKTSAPQVKAVREIFEKLPRGDLFRSRHAEGCEVCYDGPNVAPLIYCQGCSLAYHKNCLGNRSSREHLVTKVGDERFVLQCKRCVNVYQKKDRYAPNLARCQDCGENGHSCRPFRHRKTTMQEMKEREENDGDDPITDVPSELINNPHNVLFRCTKCSRAWHYHHLPPLSPYAMEINRDDEELADERFREYSTKWMCKECDETNDRKVGALIAWRPSDVETYQPGTPCELVNEDDKQYLIKWEKQSYFRAQWFSGAWTWGVSASAMRRAFFKKEEGPKMRTEDAIPEEYLRIDIVLDIKFSSIVKINSEEIDKARIKEVDKALIKYKGLGYEDAVWEKVPTPEDGDRWLDFVTAYNDWVAGRYIKIPKQGPLKSRLEKARDKPFKDLLREKQPENLTGGELMKYQMDGLNWLYYQWYKQKNGILADEMGLGKTIQVIGFMATLVQEHNCFPFIIIVPNSTCANWRREIKQWAPSLRVVAYFGSAQARDMAYKYELYPDGTKDLRCHVVITSYEAATDDSSRRFLRGVNWAGLITDEGQRLKNDKSQLYNALSAVKSPFRLLMTGTPLQNNARELFNLLQFLDETINAAELEEKYAEMTSENIKELHDMIRPFILRRTKAQVLTFLPPLGQIILPISMSHLQKQVYKSILSKSPELLKALFTSDKGLKQQERANLSNILMQLRKCLCHPFVYSREIEERTDIAAVSHRNLVEASAKLSLLETLLPKLKERGHRVLIFSQFLDMLNIIEDFLDGMQMAYQRLDGTMGSLEKQKRIDQFNAPGSPLFAFLLSTRAGGVGINLATADTVIILDPDFNPHQDLQAIARAHRIGQKNKVLCFQLLTRASVEEKIVQMGRKKMALDHVVVESLGDEDAEEHDVESILKYGAAELFKDDTADRDIHYDDASIEKLLDRSQIENTRAAEGNDSAESQFSFARVWANDTGSLQDNLDIAEEETAPDPGVWDKILKERQAQAAADAVARAHALGRGKRARVNVDYMTEQEMAQAAAEDSEEEAAPPSPVKIDKRKKKKRSDDESDTDFQVDSDEDTEVEPKAPEGDVQQELAAPDQQRSVSGLAKQSRTRPKGDGQLRIPGQPIAPPPQASPAKPPKKKSSGRPAISSFKPTVTVLKVDKTKTPSKKDAKEPTIISLLSPPASPSLTPKLTPLVKPFVRANIPIRSPFEPTQSYTTRICTACRKNHPSGACELKAAGVEHCGLCGLAHYGYGRTCPHIRSETQVREMLQALKNSPEKKELIDLAVKYLRGVKGALVQQKKRDREKAEGRNQNMGATNAAVAAATGARAPLAGSGPALHVPGGGQRQPHLNQYMNHGQGVYTPYIPPTQQQQNGTAVQRSYPQQPQGRPGQTGTGHAEGHFDERDVEDALRGVLGQ